MNSWRPLTIVGGGLAGLTLGIGLRQRSVPVTLFEAGNYPRHRVCGEFVNGRGQQTLARLNLRGELFEAGARLGSTAAFFCGRARSPVRALPEPALCLARIRLDAVLARHFQETGGVLREGQRWQGERGDEGIVCATGRRRATQSPGGAWFGLKSHASGVVLEADLEMHASPDGYVGLCRLSDGLVNVCGLFRKAGEGEAASPWQARLRGQPGTVQHERLGAATFVEGSFCSVAAISLRPERSASLPECCIGDALTMIPPVTGNGMSMAFEAAELAVGPLTAYSRGEVEWKHARRLVAESCDARFGTRLAWASWLQRMMTLGPALAPGLLSLILRWEGLWRTMFERTR